MAQGAELGVFFGPGPNPASGAMLHLSTSSLTSGWPPKRIAARAASQRVPRSEASESGLGSLPGPCQWGRNCACNYLKKLVSTLG